jgi:hypothetical protein
MAHRYAPRSKEAQPRLLEILVGVFVVLGLCALGCASPKRAAARPRPASLSVFQPPRGVPPRAGGEGAAFVAANLRRAGLTFGTDGSARALWGYLSLSHQPIAPETAAPGDVLFFDTRGTGAFAECADHAGIVERVDPEGRITFVEARGGQVRRSFVDPTRPTTRRNERGEIANSFLRIKTVDDPSEARYFAGQMLCGAVRVTAARRLLATK